MTLIHFTLNHIDSAGYHPVVITLFLSIFLYIYTYVCVCNVLCKTFITITSEILIKKNVIEAALLLQVY